MALAMSGCVTPAQVVVHVTADSETSARAAFLTFEVYATDRRDVPRYVQTEALGEGAELARLDVSPARLTVVPRDSDPDRRFLVVASLRDASRNVFSQRRAISSFIEASSSEVWLHFDDACADQLSCDGTTTCDASGPEGEPACVSACVAPSAPGSVVRSDVQSCGDDCSFGADGAACGRDGSPGRCWAGSCCHTCWNGERCLGEEELSVAGYGIEGAECVTCDCPGDGTNPEGGCLPAQSARGLRAGARHACVSFDGVMHCWGNNDAGQIGSGAVGGVVETPTPVRAAAAAMALGDHHSCAAVDGERTTCWGRGERYQLGSDDTADVAAPGVVTVPMGPFDRMSAGQWHTCGASSDGVYCWGANSDGECGQNADTIRIRQPTRVIAGLATSLDSGRRTTCAVSEGRLLCWGYNDSGGVGVPSSRTRVDAPVDVSGDVGSPWRQVTVGGFGACGLTEDDRLFCRGQVQTDVASDFDVELPDEEHLLVQIGEDRWREIHLGEHHLCGIRRDDSLACLGHNDRGQLGGEGDRRIEVGPVGLRWRSLAAGDTFTCARRQDETVWCWGDNASQQLGTSDASDLHAGGAIFSVTPRRICPPGTAP